MAVTCDFISPEHDLRVSLLPMGNNDLRLTVCSFTRVVVQTCVITVEDASKQEAFSEKFQQYTEDNRKRIVEAVQKEVFFFCEYVCRRQTLFDDLCFVYSDRIESSNDVNALWFYQTDYNFDFAGAYDKYTRAQDAVLYKRRARTYAILFVSYGARSVNTIYARGIAKIHKTDGATNTICAILTSIGHKDRALCFSMRVNTHFFENTADRLYLLEKRASLLATCKQQQLPLN